MSGGKEKGDKYPESGKKSDGPKRPHEGDLTAPENDIDTKRIKYGDKPEKGVGEKKMKDPELDID